MILHRAVGAGDNLSNSPRNAAPSIVARTISKLVFSASAFGSKVLTLARGVTLYLKGRGAPSSRGEANEKPSSNEPKCNHNLFKVMVDHRDLCHAPRLDSVAHHMGDGADSLATILVHEHNGIPVCFNEPWNAVCSCRLRSA